MMAGAVANTATNRRTVRMVGPQLLLQLPAPRGSPHEPQGAGPISRDEPEDGALTANTDNCLSSSVPVHFGHSSFVDSRTRSSKRWSQARHAYSNKGMRLL